ncbi:unnamed protein product, partial [marine sediment metagenome]
MIGEFNIALSVPSNRLTLIFFSSLKFGLRPKNELDLGHITIGILFS